MSRKTPAWTWLSIAALAALAGGVQTWVISRSVLPAQDSVKFVAFARAASERGWSPTMTDRNDSPVFPALVSVARSVWSACESLFGSKPSPDLWAASVTSAAAIPAMLAVVPLFLIVRRLFGPRAALLAGGLYAVLPTVARLGADGLSDSTQLLLILSAVWAWLSAEETANRPLRWARWIASGGCLGLACLTRIEAITVAPALLVAGSWRAAGRPRDSAPEPYSASPPRRSGPHEAGIALALGMLVWTAPYYWTTGKITPKHSLRFLAGVAVNAPPQRPEPREPSTAAPVSGEETPASFDPKDLAVSSRRYGYQAALGEFLRELPDGWSYVAGLLTLAGLAVAPRSQRNDYDVFVRCFLLLYFAALVHYAAGAGYLASRHFLIPSMLLLGWAGMALDRTLEATRRLSMRWPSPRIAQGLCLAIVAGLALASHHKPLRFNRLAYRSAGQWLARTAQTDDVVLDTRQWTGLLSGLTTYGADNSATALADPHLAFVVVEQDEIQRDSRRAQTLRTLIDRYAVHATGFDSAGLPVEAEQASVLVFAWNGAAAQASARPLRATPAARRPAGLRPRPTKRNL